VQPGRRRQLLPQIALTSASLSCTPRAASAARTAAKIAFTVRNGTPHNGGRFRTQNLEDDMTARGRSQDRKRVAGGQDYEVRYEAKKTGTTKRRVKKAVKRAGNSRKNVERELRR
jgi:uncharacterized protein DUF3606